jgi:hypothetical protein
VISQIENPTPRAGTTGIHGVRKVRGRSGCRYRSTITAVHTTRKANRIPMLVSSAASPIGRNPAMAPDAKPTIHVTRVGTCRVGCVFANHRGSSPSRDIENHTRVTPSMNVNITVRMPMIAPTAITSASAPSPPT